MVISRAKIAPTAAIARTTPMDLVPFESSFGAFVRSPWLPEADPEDDDPVEGSKVLTQFCAAKE